MGQMASYKPPNGFVPDVKTAIAIAEAVLKPIYGPDTVAREKPFHAVLHGTSVWIVKGSPPVGKFGGVATVRIQKKDGCILSVSHSM